MARAADDLRDPVPGDIADAAGGGPAPSGGRLEVLACLASEWQRAVDQGLGGQDLTVVTQVIEQGGPS